MTLDRDSSDFRAAGHRLIDWIADYVETIERHPVAGGVDPGVNDVRSRRGEASADAVEQPLAVRREDADSRRIAIGVVLGDHAWHRFADARFGNQAYISKEEDVTEERRRWEEATHRSRTPPKSA